MRIAVAPSGRRSAADAVALARLAEDAGLDEVWVSEDYVERGAFAVAGAIAAATSRVRVGLGVINPWTRHVVLTAMECRALHEISDGRSITGLGASNAGWMTGKLGIPFVKPLTVLTEYTRALRDLLAGDHVQRTVAGWPVDTRLDGSAPGALPIIWGVKGERALTSAAEQADGVMLSVLSSPAYVEWVRRTHGATRVTAYASFLVDADRETARDRLRAHTARYLGLHGDSPITALAGIEAGTAAEIRRRFLAGESATDLVDDAMVAAVTISGTPQDAADGLLAQQRAGVDTLVVIDDGSSTPDNLVAAVVDAAGRAGLLQSR